MMQKLLIGLFVFFSFVAGAALAAKFEDRLICTEWIDVAPEVLATKTFAQAANYGITKLNTDYEPSVTWVLADMEVLVYNKEKGVKACVPMRLRLVPE